MLIAVQACSIVVVASPAARPCWSNPAFDVAGVHPAMELQEERGARESLWQAGLFIRVPLVCALCIPRQCDFVGSGL